VVRVVVVASRPVGAALDRYELGTDEGSAAASAAHGNSDATADGRVVISHRRDETRTRLAGFSTTWLTAMEHP
jgi:hypothetical protein